MNNIIIDFETMSDRDINDGYKNYCSTVNSRVLCMSYKVNDEPTQVWTPPTPFPLKNYTQGDYRIYAHNAHFDLYVWNHLCVPHYGWPKLEVEKVVDIMAICGRFTYPLGLDRVGYVLNLDIQKDQLGKKLIKICCTPPFNATPKELFQLYVYCRRDADTEYELLKNLPASSLSKIEQQYWLDTVTVNENGIPIDYPTVLQIHQVIESFTRSKTKIIAKLTGGRVHTVKQIKKMREFLAEHGVDLPNLQIKTVEKALLGPLDDIPRQLLELRAELSQSSVAKYSKLLQLYDHTTGRIYDNIYYYKASTGRYAGRGFQGHNLPRAKVADPGKRN